MIAPSSLPGNLFLRVEGVKIDDIPNWSRPSPPPQQEINMWPEEKPCAVRTSKPCVSTKEMAWEGLRRDKGFLVEINDELVALFKVEGEVYAVRDSCPHAGGPLSAGDIEELPGEGLCVRCPWHQWKILLKSGNIGEHRDRQETAIVYPVKVDSEGDIYVGMKQFPQHYFNIDMHPSVDVAPKTKRRMDIQYCQ